jgi:hypothetical protein
MLTDNNIASNTPFLAAMSLCLSTKDIRNEALVKTGDKKQAYSEYVNIRVKREKEEVGERVRRARGDFGMLCEEFCGDSGSSYEVTDIGTNGMLNGKDFNAIDDLFRRDAKYKLRYIRICSIIDECCGEVTCVGGNGNGGNGDNDNDGMSSSSCHNILGDAFRNFLKDLKTRDLRAVERNRANAMSEFKTYLVEICGSGGIFGVTFDKEVNKAKWESKEVMWESCLTWLRKTKDVRASLLLPYENDKLREVSRDQFFEHVETMERERKAKEGEVEKMHALNYKDYIGVMLRDGRLTKYSRWRHFVGMLPIVDGKNEEKVESIKFVMALDGDVARDVFEETIDKALNDKSESGSSHGNGNGGGALNGDSQASKRQKVVEAGEEGELSEGELSEGEC